MIGPDGFDFRHALTTLFDVGSITDRIDLFNIVCVPGLTDADDDRHAAAACA